MGKKDDAKKGADPKLTPPAKDTPDEVSPEETPKTPPEETTPETPESGFGEFRHNCMNTRLPLEHPNYKEGSQGITITLQKAKDVKWGYYTAPTDRIARLIKKSPLFGKRIFEMTPEDEKEKAKVLGAKKPHYKTGVQGIIA